MQQELKPHGMTVSDAPSYMPGKPGSVVKVVRYYIGPHGPFTDTYAQADYTLANVNAGIDKNLTILQALTPQTGA